MLERAWRSLRGRLVLGTAVSVGAVTLVVGLLLQYSVHASIEGNWLRELRDELITLQHLATELPPVRLASGRASEPYSGHYWQIGTGMPDDPIYAQSPSLAGYNLAEAGPIGGGTLRLAGPLEEDLLAVSARALIGGEARPVVVARDAQQLNELLGAVDRLLLWGLLNVWVISVIVAALVAGAFTRPLGRLRDELQQLQANKRGRLSRSPLAEVDALAGQLNTLAEQNTQRLARQRQAAATLAHELKTPLTALLRQCDESANVDSAQLRQHLQRMLPPLDDTLARARIHGPAPGLPAVAVQDHVQRAVGLCALDHGLEETAFELMVPADLHVHIEPRDLDTVLWNLIDNACKHGAPPVRIHADADGLVVESAGAATAESSDAPLPGSNGLRLVGEILDAYGANLTHTASVLGGRATHIAWPA